MFQITAAGGGGTCPLSSSSRSGADADCSRPAAHVQHHRIFAEFKVLPDKKSYGVIGGGGRADVVRTGGVR